jgi:hypothetical protein
VKEMKDATQTNVALAEDTLTDELELIQGDNFERLNELDLAEVTLSDLEALKDTVFRSALIGIATMPEISLQVSHQNGSHSSHGDHTTHTTSAE